MKEQKLHSVLQITIAILMVWLVNQLIGFSPIRWDLTEEKRYTITDATRSMLQSLDEDVFVEVYLAGDLPANFERFKNSVGEMLEQFALESGNMVSYQFTDPSQASSAQARNQFYESLINKGVQATNLNYKSSDGDRMEKLIFPGALVSMGMEELPANLLKGNSAAGPEEMLNQAVEGLEYQLASTIAQLNGGGTKKVAYITGHGSPDSLEIAGFKQTVLSRFDLYNVSLSGKKELTGYDVAVIAKPNGKFSEADKYLLDQFLMRGGNLLYFVDALSVNPDSIFGEGTVAIPRELNLTDQLFKYGVRINKNYVLDVNSGQFPVVTGNIGDQPQIQMIPWPFYPVISNFSKHPSVRNLDAILGKFVSELDTVKAEGIRKTPLLSTSQYSNLIAPPVRVAFNDLRNELTPEKFKGARTIGYLLEGQFTSLYANRLVPRGFDKNQFLAKGQPGKVVVIGDGDIVRNEINPETGEPLELGVEPFTNAKYANQDFVLNLLDYLMDDSGLIDARSREVKIRPLDRIKVQNQRVQLQVLNLVVPLLLVIILGLFKWFIRRRNFARQ